MITQKAENFFFDTKWKKVKADHRRETLTLHWNLDSKIKTVMAYGWFVSACLSVSYCSHIHMYNAEAGRAGLRTAWGCFALSVSNCLTTSSYSLYSTLHVFLKCFPLSSLKAKHVWSPLEAGQMAHTPAVKRSQSTFINLSIRQGLSEWIPEY